VINLVLNIIKNKMKTTRNLFMICSLIGYSITNAQIIKTIVGNGSEGYMGDGGLAQTAQLYNPSGIALDKLGNIYIADEGNTVIRKVTSVGMICTVAGNDTATNYENGKQATDVVLSLPIKALPDDSGNLFIVDMITHSIRKVNVDGIISTVAGNGTAGYSGDGGAATDAQLYYPQGLALYGNSLYISDQSNRIRCVTNGIITTIAGTVMAGYSGDGGQATDATLNQPYGMVCNSSGDLYIADSENNVIRLINKKSGIITTVVGNGVIGFSGDERNAASAQLNFPTDVAIFHDTALYVADAGNYRIRMVISDTINTIAGNGNAGYTGDNSYPVLAEIGSINGLAMDSIGNLYMSDYGNHVIREITYSAFTTGKKLLSSSNNHINIYPNPTQNLVTINAANNKENEKTNTYQY
jgi:hypothetical protein